MDDYKFLESFLEKCGSKVVFLCGDTSREFCEKMANVAKLMNRQATIFEIIKEQQRKRIVEAAERKTVGNILGFLTRSQTMLRFIQRFVQIKVNKEVIESVKNCNAVVWAGLGEDFDVFYIAARRLVDAVMDKSFLLLSFPSRYTAEKLGMSYDDYWRIFFEALNYPWEKMKNLGENLKAQLINKNTLHVTSLLGTDFSLRFKADDIRIFYGIVNEKSLSTGKVQLQLPAGELFIRLRGTEVNGEMVFDVPCLFNGQILSNIKVVAKNGKVIDYQLDKCNTVLMRIFEKRELRSINEVGFGLNPAVKPFGSINLDEKAYKTIHIGFAQMKTYGHLDLVMSNPIVYVNGEKLKWSI